MTYIHIAAVPGHTIDDFRKVNSKTKPPEDIDGLISWAAGSDDGGLHVVAVWESQAHADRYAAEQLFPAFQEFGLAPDMMETTTYDADEFYLRS
jgi:uncharacterized protein YbaA (DUF1428 family)